MSYSQTQGNSGGGGSKEPEVSSFMNAIHTQFNTQVGTGMVHGENGAPAHSMYNMSGITNTNLQGALVAAFNGMLRGTTDERTYKLMEHVFQEAKSAGGTYQGKAVADLFVSWAQCRDRNDGKGERLVSYHMFMWLYEHFPKTTLELLRQYPTLGYWKDLSQLYLLATQKNDTTARWTVFKQNIVNCFVRQLTEDTDELNRNSRSINISLCAKYVPKEGRSFDKQTKITKAIAGRLFPTIFKDDFRFAMKKFRALYTRLNRHIDTVEIKECSGRWSEIDFNRVPGRALNIQRKAFLNVSKGKGEDLRHPDNEDRMKCRKHFQTHLEKAVSGKVKVKGKTMFIHELVEQIINGRLNTPEERVLIEAQWNTHIEHFRETMEETNSSLGKGVCIVDVSGSMYGTPMNVAIAMGIFASSFAHPAFRDRFISFESTPHWIHLRYPNSYSEFHSMQGYKSALGQWEPSRSCGELTLYEKVKVAQYSPWGGSTDFMAAHELILRSCILAKLQPEELPEWFMILSDMQFNAANQPQYCNNNYSYLNSLGVKYNVLHRKTGYGYYNYNTNNKHKPTPWTTIHETLGQAYHKAGMKACGKPYNIPQQIYWNLRGDTVGFPVQSDTPNTQMISGFSVSLLKLFLNETAFDAYETPVKVTPTPWDTFRKAVDNKNYNIIRRVCDNSTEGALRSYHFIELEEEEYEIVD